MRLNYISLTQAINLVDQHKIDYFGEVIVEGEKIFLFSIQDDTIDVMKDVEEYGEAVFRKWEKDCKKIAHEGKKKKRKKRKPFNGEGIL